MTINDDRIAELRALQAATDQVLGGPRPEQALARFGNGQPVSYDRRTWSQAAEMGLMGLNVPEELGGSGCGLVEVAAVLHQMGRVLYDAPYFSTVVLATTALLASEDFEARQELLPSIAAGTMTATFADTWAHPANDIVSASEHDDVWTLSGSTSFVRSGLDSDVLLVPARKSGRPELFAVEAGARGLVRSPMRTLDVTMPLASVRFDSTPARRIVGDLSHITERVLVVGAAAMAAEQTGAARQCLELAVNHAKTRVQFGQPIGAFQAIKHKCADMLLEVEASSAASRSAAHALDDGDEFAGMLASLARVVASDALMTCAAECIQVLGGIGFTWEHPAHLFFKRAKASALVFGDVPSHRERLAVQLGI